jgi:GNAT superfamily N-acetyltransferase
VSGPDWQAVVDGTWPAERIARHGAWTIRTTPGAGGRVNAVSRPDAGLDGLESVEARLRAEGRAPSFVIWPAQGALDAALEARGYAVEDAVHVWSTAPAPLAGPPLPPATAFPVWPPLAAMRDLWAEGGIGAARQAVMARAAARGAGTGLLARVQDRAAGVAFVSAHEGSAMLHALEVVPARRRRGVGRLLMRAAAAWAAAEGCTRLALVVTRGNAPANALYASLGMEIVEGYHYRRARP